MQKLIHYLRLAFVIISFGLINTYSFSAHQGAASTEITYRWIDTLTYEVQYVYYRSCTGQSFTVPVNGANVVCNASGKSERLTLTLKSISEVKIFCDSMGSQCKGANQNRSGDGTERLVYLDTVDFRKSPFSGLISAGCTELRFDTEMCCRNANITTGASGKTNYNWAILSLKNNIKNSSPQFTFDPFFVLGVNQTAHKSVGAIDTIDGDSLSFKIVEPYSEWNKAISVSSPPLTVYYPTGLKYPYSNPNASPPIGFYFNEKIGELICAPTKAYEHTVLVFEVAEWRKDSSGKYQKIGTIRRDVDCFVSPININNSPVIFGDYTTRVCEGDSVCVSVRSSDKVKSSSYNSDTVSLQWNRGIPAGHFTIDNKSALNQSAKFCWQTQKGDARSLPYHFTVEANDDNCPLPSKTERVFQVIVSPKSTASIELDTLSCGKYVVNAVIDSSTAEFPLKYSWEVNPLGGISSNSRKPPLFNSSSTYISNKQTDTIQFQRGGTYIVKQTLTNTFQCPVISYDTIDVPDVLEVLVASQTDTFLCKGNSIELSARVMHGSNKVTYSWSNDSIDAKSTFSLSNSVNLRSISIVVIDTNGCIAKDEISLIQRSRPIIDDISDIEICFGDSVDITPKGQLALWDDPRTKDTTKFSQGSVLIYDLYTKGVFTLSDSVFQLKNYTDYQIVATDSLGCSDTTAFKVQYPKGKGLNDIEVCVSESDIDLRTIETSDNQGGIWYCPSMKGAVKDDYLLILDSFEVTTFSKTLPIYYNYKGKALGCTILDSLDAIVHPLPNFKLVDSRFCQNMDTIDVIEDSLLIAGNITEFEKGIQKWSCLNCGFANPNDVVIDTIGDKLPQKILLDVRNSILKHGSKDSSNLSFRVFVTSVHGCSKLDTANITVMEVPSINFDPFYDLCWNEGIVDLKVLSRVAPSNGAWKAIDAAGYAKASGLNAAITSDTLNGDTLFTLGTPRPAEGSSFTYVMRYFQTTSGCSSYRDTFLTIRGLPEPIIDKSIFYTGKDTTEPFSICSSSSDLQLNANYSGGVWSANEPQVIIGSVFKPSNIQTTNNTVTLFYEYTDIYGCQGKDSAKLVTVDPDGIKVSPKDTSFTWYSTAMKLDISANAGSGRGVIWKALDQGSFGDSTKLTTQYNFSTNKDDVTILRVEANADGSSNVCPPAKDTITVNVYQSPCVNFNMKLDLGTKILTLIPFNSTLSDYTWTVADSIIKGSSPKVDVSSFGDSTIWIHLETVNALENKCRMTNRINLKTGSLKSYNKSPLVIYPNPVKSYLRIESEHDFNNSEVTVYSSTGSSVSMNVESDNVLNFKYLAPGLYFVLIKKEGVYFSGKFLKE